MTKTNDKLECPEYNELIKKVEDTREEVKRAGKSAIAALFKVFFAAHPEVTAIGWAQYTPYFNDGDPCVFHVYDFYVSLKKDVDFAEVQRVDEGDVDTGFVYPNMHSVTPALSASVARLERSVNNAIFGGAFGDHTTVIATPTGFHVNSYSHD